MINTISIIIINSIPISILEVVIYNNWTIYDTLEVLLC